MASKKSDVAASDIRREIGARFRSERERLGLTQQALAKELGIQRQALLLYESGERSPLADKLHSFDRVGGDTTFIITGLKTAVLDAEGQRDLELAMSSVVMMCRAVGVDVDEVSKLRLAFGLIESMRQVEDTNRAKAEAFELLRASVLARRRTDQPLSGPTTRQ